MTRPGPLALEITGTALLADPEATAARLENLRRVAGMRLSRCDCAQGFYFSRRAPADEHAVSDLHP